jgi:CubicO group peptidase (beta-lactamase class C family)
MSKPIASVAVMILYDQGKISLDDPLAKHIPQFRNMRMHIAARMAISPESRYFCWSPVKV